MTVYSRRGPERKEGEGEEIRRPRHDQDTGQEGERTTMFSPGSWKSRLEKKPGRSVTVENGISIVRTGTTVPRNEQRSDQLRWIVKVERATDQSG